MRSPFWNRTWVAVLTLVVVGAGATVWGEARLPATRSSPAQVSRGPAPPLGQTVSGAVRMTTANDGSWTAVTVAPQPGASVAVAFVLQYQNPPSTVAEYDGLAGATLDKESLVVKTAHRRWLFKFPSYSGPVWAGDVALDVIGIASYFWPEAAPHPASHEEFVRSLTIPPVCDYSQCQCGGAGAQSCTCGGCSVSCYAPYEACCNGHGGCWCCQASDQSDRGRVQRRR